MQCERFESAKARAGSPFGAVVQIQIKGANEDHTLKSSLEFDLSKETCEEQEVEMDIIWNQDSHTQPLATMLSISTRVGLQQQSSCANDFLEIRHRQKRLFNLDASDNLYESGVFFRFHRLH